MKTLEDHIRVYDNALNADQCEIILTRFKGSPLWNIAGQGSNTTDPNLRNCDTIDISDYKSNNNAHLDLDEMLFRGVGKTIAQYIKEFTRVMIKHDTGYEILRYNTGTECKEHVDSYPDRPRTLSCSINLNDDYEGGEFTFFGGSLRYRVPKGSAIVFPSNFMYPHAVAPVTAGSRYSIITWLV
jgi:predicted 2-oxoglutarate/Fe(II)-dependent dioxygenase YbiX